MCHEDEAREHPDLGSGTGFSVGGGEGFGGGEAGDEPFLGCRGGECDFGEELLGAEDRGLLAGLVLDVGGMGLAL